jgi:hypothetical protein
VNVIVQIYGRCQPNDIIIGEALIPLMTLHNQFKHHQWYPLKMMIPTSPRHHAQTSGHTSSNIDGPCVELSLQWMHDIPTLLDTLRPLGTSFPFQPSIFVFIAP